MSNIKSEIGIVLVVAVTAIVFTALVASPVSPVQAADGNSSSSANNTSALPSSGSGADNVTASAANSTWIYEVIYAIME